MRINNHISCLSNSFNSNPFYIKIKYTSHKMASPPRPTKQDKNLKQNPTTDNTQQNARTTRPLKMGTTRQSSKQQTPQYTRR